MFFVGFNRAKPGFSEYYDLNLRHCKISRFFVAGDILIVGGSLHKTHFFHGSFNYFADAGKAKFILEKSLYGHFVRGIQSTWHISALFHRIKCQGKTGKCGGIRFFEAQIRILQKVKTFEIIF
jgi:hypothetical protein